MGSLTVARSLQGDSTALSAGFPPQLDANPYTLLFRATLSHSADLHYMVQPSISLLQAICRLLQKHLPVRLDPLTTSLAAACLLVANFTSSRRLAFSFGDSSAAAKSPRPALFPCVQPLNTSRPLSMVDPNHCLCRPLPLAQPSYVLSFGGYTFLSFEPVLRPDLHVHLSFLQLPVAPSVFL